jgi:hypothetical protein
VVIQTTIAGFHSFFDAPFGTKLGFLRDWYAIRRATEQELLGLPRPRNARINSAQNFPSAGDENKNDYLEIL